MLSLLLLLLLSFLKEPLDSCRQSSTPRCNHQLHPDSYTILYGFLWLGSLFDNSEMLMPRMRLMPRMMPRRMQRIPRMMRRMPRIMQEGSQEGCKRFATVRGSVLPFFKPSTPSHYNCSQRSPADIINVLKDRLDLVNPLSRGVLSVIYEGPALPLGIPS
jgi:hypothetical protein